MLSNLLRLWFQFLQVTVCALSFSYLQLDRLTESKLIPDISVKLVFLHEFACFQWQIAKQTAKSFIALLSVHYFILWKAKYSGYVILCVFLCSMQHVPGFITQAEHLKAKGVDEILLISGRLLAYLCFYVYISQSSYFHLKKSFGNILIWAWTMCVEHRLILPSETMAFNLLWMAVR